MGLIVLVAGLFLTALGGAILSKFDLPFLDRLRGRARGIAILGVGGVAILAGATMTAFSDDGRGSTENNRDNVNIDGGIDSGGGDVIINNGMPSDDSPSSTVVPTSGPCATEDDSASLDDSIYITVPYWCHGNGLYYPDGSPKVGVVQWKLRLILTNTTNEPWNISIETPSTIRLIVEDPRDLASMWAPNEKTRSKGDKPERVTIDGKSYWAVPPNVRLSEQSVTVSDERGTFRTYTGFATYWDKGATLSPGETVGSKVIGQIDEFDPSSGSPVKGDPSTDLVFEVPESADIPGATRIRGVAIFTGPQEGKPPAEWCVIGEQLQSDWGQQYDNNFF